MKQMSLPFHETSLEKATKIWDEVVRLRKLRPQGFVETKLHRTRMIEAFVSMMDNSNYDIVIKNGDWTYKIRR